MEISHAAIILITRTLGFLAAAAAVQLRQLVLTYVCQKLEPRFIAQLVCTIY